jgi:hypothetical protein
VENSVDNVDNYWYRDFIKNFMLTLLRKSHYSERAKMFQQIGKNGKLGQGITANGGLKNFMF